MKILIDTQIILYSLFEKSKLSTEALKILSDLDNEIMCSSISVFEISLKYSIGKLKLKGISPDQIPESLIQSGFQIENIDYSIFSSFHQLPTDIHKDPFDRLIIWHAIQKEYTLLSCDKAFIHYKKYGLKII